MQKFLLRPHLIRYVEIEEINTVFMTKTPLASQAYCFSFLNIFKKSHGVHRSIKTAWGGGEEPKYVWNCHV